MAAVAITRSIPSSIPSSSIRALPIGLRFFTLSNCTLEKARQAAEKAFREEIARNPSGYATSLSSSSSSGCTISTVVMLIKESEERLTGQIDSVRKDVKALEELLKAPKHAVSTGLELDSDVEKRMKAFIKISEARSEVAATASEERSRAATTASEVKFMLSKR